MTRKLSLPAVVFMALIMCLVVFGDLRSAMAGNPTVKAAQEKLAAQGYNPGPADGLLGSQTKRAIEAFQRDHSLTVTGTLDQKTAERLGIERPKTETATRPKVDPEKPNIVEGKVAKIDTGAGSLSPLRVKGEKDEGELTIKAGQETKYKGGKSLKDINVGTNVRITYVRQFVLTGMNFATFSGSGEWQNYAKEIEIK